MKPTLIIVDDVKAIRESLYSALQDDFEILGDFAEAPSGVAGALRLRPNLILMDLVLPGMSGIEAMEAIQAKLHPAPKIVFLSGVTEEKWVMKALDRGASDYLFKPVSDEDLLHALHRLMREPELQPETEI